MRLKENVLKEQFEEAQNAVYQLLEKVRTIYYESTDETVSGPDLFGLNLSLNSQEVREQFRRLREIQMPEAFREHWTSMVEYTENLYEQYLELPEGVQRTEVSERLEKALKRLKRYYVLLQNLAKVGVPAFSYRGHNPQTLRDQLLNSMVENFKKGNISFERALETYFELAPILRFEGEAFRKLRTQVFDSILRGGPIPDSQQALQRMCSIAKSRGLSIPSNPNALILAELLNKELLHDNNTDNYQLEAEYLLGITSGNAKKWARKALDYFESGDERRAILALHVARVYSINPNDERAKKAAKQLEQGLLPSNYEETLAALSVRYTNASFTQAERQLRTMRGELGRRLREHYEELSHEQKLQFLPFALSIYTHRRSLSTEEINFLLNVQDPNLAIRSLNLFIALRESSPPSFVREHARAKESEIRQILISGDVGRATSEFALYASALQFAEAVDSMRLNRGHERLVRSITDLFKANQADYREAFAQAIEQFNTAFSERYSSLRRSDRTETIFQTLAQRAENGDIEGVARLLLYLRFAARVPRLRDAALAAGELDAEAESQEAIQQAAAQFNSARRALLQRRQLRTRLRRNYSKIVESVQPLLLELYSSEREEDISRARHIELTLRDIETVAKKGDVEQFQHSVEELEYLIRETQLVTSYERNVEVTSRAARGMLQVLERLRGDIRSLETDRANYLFPHTLLSEVERLEQTLHDAIRTGDIDAVRETRTQITTLLNRIAKIKILYQQLSFISTLRDNSESDVDRSLSQAENQYRTAIRVLLREDFDFDSAKVHVQRGARFLGQALTNIHRSRGLLLPGNLESPALLYSRVIGRLYETPQSRKIQLLLGYLQRFNLGVATTTGLQRVLMSARSWWQDNNPVGTAYQSILNFYQGNTTQSSVNTALRTFERELQFSSYASTGAVLVVGLGLSAISFGAGAALFLGVSSSELYTRYRRTGHIDPTLAVFVALDAVPVLGRVARLGRVALTSSRIATSSRTSRAVAALERIEKGFQVIDLSALAALSVSGVGAALYYGLQGDYSQALLYGGMGVLGALGAFSGLRSPELRVREMSLPQMNSQNFRIRPLVLSNVEEVRSLFLSGRLDVSSLSKEELEQVLKSVSGHGDDKFIFVTVREQPNIEEGAERLAQFYRSETGTFVVRGLAIDPTTGDFLLRELNLPPELEEVFRFSGMVRRSADGTEYLFAENFERFVIDKEFRQTMLEAYIRETAPLPLVRRGSFVVSTGHVGPAIPLVRIKAISFSPQTRRGLILDERGVLRFGRAPKSAEETVSLAAFHRFRTLVMLNGLDPNYVLRDGRPAFLVRGELPDSLLDFLSSKRINGRPLVYRIPFRGRALALDETTLRYLYSEQFAEEYAKYLLKLNGFSSTDLLAAFVSSDMGLFDAGLRVLSALSRNPNVPLPFPLREFLVKKGILTPGGSVNRATLDKFIRRMRTNQSLSARGNEFLQVLRESVGLERPLTPTTPRRLSRTVQVNVSPELLRLQHLRSNLQSFDALLEYGDLLLGQVMKISREVFNRANALHGAIVYDGQVHVRISMFPEEVQEFLKATRRARLIGGDYYISQLSISRREFLRFLAVRYNLPQDVLTRVARIPRSEEQIILGTFRTPNKRQSGYINLSFLLGFSEIFRELRFRARHLARYEGIRRFVPLNDEKLRALSQRLQAVERESQIIISERFAAFLNNPAANRRTARLAINYVLPYLERISIRGTKEQKEEARRLFARFYLSLRRSGNLSPAERARLNTMRNNIFTQSYRSEEALNRIAKREVTEIGEAMVIRSLAGSANALPTTRWRRFRENFEVIVGRDAIERHNESLADALRESGLLPENYDVRYNWFTNNVVYGGFRTLTAVVPSVTLPARVFAQLALLTLGGFTAAYAVNLFTNAANLRLSQQMELARDVLAEDRLNPFAIDQLEQFLENYIRVEEQTTLEEANEELLAVFRQSNIFQYIGRNDQLAKEERRKLVDAVKSILDEHNIADAQDRNALAEELVREFISKKDPGVALRLLQIRYSDRTSAEQRTQRTVSFGLNALTEEQQQLARRLWSTYVYSDLEFEHVEQAYKLLSQNAELREQFLALPFRTLRILAIERILNGQSIEGLNIFETAPRGSALSNLLNNGDPRTVEQLLSLETAKRNILIEALAKLHGYVLIPFRNLDYNKLKEVLDDRAALRRIFEDAGGAVVRRLALNPRRDNDYPELLRRFKPLLPEAVHSEQTVEQTVGETRVRVPESTGLRIVSVLNDLGIAVTDPNDQRVYRIYHFATNREQRELEKKNLQNSFGIKVITGVEYEQLPEDQRASYRRLIVGGVEIYLSSSMRSRRRRVVRSRSGSTTGRSRTRSNSETPSSRSQSEDISRRSDDKRSAPSGIDL